MREGDVIRLINVHGEVKKHYHVTDTLHAMVNDLLPLMSRTNCLLLGGDVNVRYQDDYLFASPPLASRLAGIEVLDTFEVQKVSDHNPMIATFKEDKESESVSQK